jgi:predicted NUDIX family NTP pyrophosphohydrolase
MPQVSAGLVLVRRGDGDEPEVLLVHPGGPFFAKKDAGAWSIPKGLVDDGEDLLAAAKRETREELGAEIVATVFFPLGEVTQKSKKRVHAWACASEFDPNALASNTFELEWPPRSGKKQRFPEVDRAAWLRRPTALDKVLEAQRPFVERALAEDCLTAIFERGELREG